MRVAALLFVLIGVTHYAPDLIGLQYMNPSGAAKAWYYILRGFEGVALFALIGATTKSLSVGVVCLWGLLEEAQTSVCRLAKPIGEAPAHELFSGLCGEPFYKVSLTAAALIGLAIYYEIGRRRGPKRPG